MIINVTQEHIDKGRKGICYSCPVALALEAAFPGASAFARTDIVGFNKPMGARAIFGTPPEVVEFIDAFDAGNPVAPFSFTLDHSDPAAP